MKAIIHIGRQKTGTTSLQSFLKANALELETQDFRYSLVGQKTITQREFAISAKVASGRPIPKGNTKLFYGLKTNEDAKNLADRFNNEFEQEMSGWNEKCFLLSSEYLNAWFDQTDQIKELDAYFSRFFSERGYVIYLRRQEDHVLSSYSQRLKSSKVITLDEYIQQSHKFNYNRLVTNWANAVGRENLAVRLFEKDNMLNGDLIEDYCHLVGIDLANLKRPAHKNEALSSVAMDVLYQLNKTLPKFKPDGTMNEARKGVVTQLMNLDETTEKKRLTSSQLDLIRSANKQSNEKLRAEFFPELAELFPSRPDQVFASADRSHEEKVSTLMKKIEAQLNPRPSRLKSLLKFRM
ncbi:MAG: hypothetical protein ABJO27_04795 [Pseudoruegeria sp.]